ncbi:unnamed protein product [Spodoptera littoralis]|uniref:Transmembrane protein 9 n=1 Tax=Spodoptera littoralis TaxID=7109 RepID=A0A9P0IIM5_SPOLI|nr:unnamed protein product [Spodoptera littoralis]CAH1647391.1 unnamed protein product [Spodoptera littoralis]
MYFKFIAIVFAATCAVFVTAHSYEDNRCKCVCPSPAAVLNNTTGADRSPFMKSANVQPNKCNCESVILPRVADQIKGREQEFCPRCECKYENRNTTIIKVVVIIVIWVIMLLVVYMGFLICLDPLINKRAKASYQEHTNEDASFMETRSFVRRVRHTLERFAARTVRQCRFRRGAGVVSCVLRYGIRNRIQS